MDLEEHSVGTSIGNVPDFLGGRKLEEGIGLCLSGGGYRAMLFHVGSLCRLNEVGLLSKVSRVASVSGGSITAGALAVAWNDLDFDSLGVANRFSEKVGSPLFNLAGKFIDIPAAVLGLLPFVKAANVAASLYDRFLYRGKTLQDLPRSPRFVFNATSLQTGVLWRFGRDYAADYRVGEWRSPALPIALAVGASAAFPPYLSPLRIVPPDGAIRALDGADRSFPPYTSKLLLTDGGIYDNLALEPVWKRYRTLLVSDGGAVTPTIPGPWTNWLSQSVRSMYTSLQQGTNTRVRILRGLRETGQRKVAYWAISRPISTYSGGSPLAMSEHELASARDVPTRLTRTPEGLRRRIIRSGYAHCDLSLRDAGLLPENAIDPDFRNLERIWKAS